MCAIFGIIGKSNLNLIKNMSNIQKFRGPDKQSFFNCENGFLTMGNNRLSVIDAKNGDQPMFSSDGRFVVVFNGCIYNFKEIREALIKKKILFKSYSDTEVVANAFMEYGASCFNYFDGMWAISIYDIKEKKIYLSRDYVGQKPLYYTKNKNYLLFSSQIKGLFEDKDINKIISYDNLKKYHAYSFIPAPDTLYKNIFQVNPGEYLEINVTNIKVDKKIYWDLESGPDYNQFFKEEKNSDYLSSFDNLLEQFYFADMKPALTLSGGIDSNIIFNRLNNKKKDLTTYTLGFDNDSFDESKFIDSSISNCDNKIFKINNETLIDNFKKLSKKITEPNGDSSILPTYILFNKIKNNTKVSIGGDGGDESFFGYITFDAFFIANYVKKIFPKTILKYISNLTNFQNTGVNYMTNKYKIKKFFEPINSKKKYLLPAWMSALSLEELNLKFQSSIHYEDIFSDSKKIFENKNNLIRNAQMYYFKFYLPMVLSKVDQASMFNSVENRSPFISKKIINFSLNANLDELYSFFIQKKFLKKKYNQILNKKIFKRPKHGFAFQKDIILKDKELINSILKSDYIINKNFFNDKYSQFLDGNNYYSNYIWNELIINIVQQNN